MKHALLFAVITTIVFCTSLYAQVPNKLSYQGLLTNSSGVPVIDGSYNLKFDLYNLSSGGTNRYTETQTSVPVEHGTFSVIINSPSSLFSESLWVQVTALSGPGISSQMVFAPRAELTTAPYAFRADTARYALSAPSQWITSGSDIYYNTGRVGIGTPTPSGMLDIRTASGGDHIDFSTSSSGPISIHLKDTQRDYALVNSFSFGDKFSIFDATASSERLVIDGPTGNVGIGKSSPDVNAKLDVNGYAFAKAPVVVYDSAAGSGTNFDITWLNDVRVDNNLIEKQANNYEFKLKKAGWFRVSYGLTLAGTTETFYMIYVKKNGSTFKYPNLFRGTGFNQVSGSIIIYSGGNDLIKLFARSNNNLTFNVDPDNGYDQISVEYLGAE